MSQNATNLYQDMSLNTRSSRKRTARRGVREIKYPTLILPHILCFIYHLVGRYHALELGYTSSASSIILRQCILYCCGATRVRLYEGGCTHVIRLRAKWVSAEVQKKSVGGVCSRHDIRGFSKDISWTLFKFDGYFRI